MITPTQVIVNFYNGCDNYLMSDVFPTKEDFHARFNSIEEAESEALKYCSQETVKPYTRKATVFTGFVITSPVYSFFSRLYIETFVKRETRLNRI